MKHVKPLLVSIGHTLLVTVLLVFSLWYNASSALELDDDKGDTTFRVEGKIVEPDTAILADASGKNVLRCKPKDASGKKAFYTKDGAALGQIIECSPVEAKVNPKSGNVGWKAKK